MGNIQSMQQKANQITLETPMQLVKGVGPSRAASFVDLGVQTVGDLWEYFFIKKLAIGVFSRMMRA